MRRLRFMAVPVFLVTLGAGCHVHRPADPVSLQPGEELTIVLSPEGRARLNEISTRGGGEVTGQLVRLTADSLSLTARLDAGGSVAPATRSDLRQQLSFARDDIERVSTPELHRGRTAAVLGAAAVIATWLVIELFDISGNGPGPGPTPGPGPSPFGPGG